MINKVGKITIYVNDQEQAKDFWINKMNFALKFEQQMGPNAAWVEVAPSKDEFTTLVLYSKSMMEKQRPEKVAHPNLLFSTTDIESAHQTMQANGVEVEPINKMPFGTMFTFKDQDGNEYILREDK